MAIENQILLISYVTLAAVIAMIYGMRRIFILESKIVRLEQAILGKKRKRSAKPKRRVAKRKTTKRRKKRR